MMYTLPGKSVGYANSDPRKQQLGDAAMGLGGYSSSSRLDKWGSSNLTRSPATGAFQDGNISPMPGGMLLPPSASGVNAVPPQYRLQRSAQVGKQQRYLKYNYWTSNVSVFCVTLCILS